MEWLINLGYVGLFIGCCLAGSFIPVSSDVFLIGMLLAGGNAWACLIIGTIGYWIGSMTSYGIGWAGKLEWLERFKVKKEKIEHQKKNIDKYGVWIALFAWIPIFGSITIFTLGFYKVKPKAAATLMLIGCFLRFLIWTFILKAALGEITELV